MAYRGRVLVEVEVDVGEFPTSKQEAIKQSELERILVSGCGRALPCYVACILLHTCVWSDHHFVLTPPSQKHGLGRPLSVTEVHQKFGLSTIDTGWDLIDHHLCSRLCQQTLGEQCEG